MGGGGGPLQGVIKSYFFLAKILFVALTIKLCLDGYEFMQLFSFIFPLTKHTKIQWNSNKVNKTKYDVLTGKKVAFITSTNSRTIIVLAIARTIKYFEFVSVIKVTLFLPV